MSGELLKAIEGEAELRQIKTMADHTVNVTLNIPEYCLPQVQVMMAWLGDCVKFVFERSGDG